jgi:hypothetical protein
MSRGVIFFNAGTKHCVHTAVAVASLRNHYKGPVALITEQSGPGRDACELIASDDRLAPIEVIAHQDMRTGAHGVSYFCKTLLPRIAPFDATIFFDADTIICGDISELWPDESTGEIVLTQFADWVSTGGKMQQRINAWRDVEPQRVERMGEKPWPAINTGVMAWSKQSESFCEDWTMTTRKRMVFMADETAAQIIFPDHPYRIMDDRFNASIVHPRKGEDVLTRDDVRILHFHGGKAWKRPQGRQLYMPHYLECLKHDLGGVRAMPPHPKWFSYLDGALRASVMEYLQPSAVSA